MFKRWAAAAAAAGGTGEGGTEDAGGEAGGVTQFSAKARLQEIIRILSAQRDELDGKLQAAEDDLSDQKALREHWEGRAIAAEDAVEALARLRQISDRMAASAVLEAEESSRREAVSAAAAAEARRDAASARDKLRAAEARRVASDRARIRAELDGGGRGGGGGLKGDAAYAELAARVSASEGAIEEAAACRRENEMLSAALADAERALATRDADLASAQRRMHADHFRIDRLEHEVRSAARRSEEAARMVRQAMEEGDDEENIVVGATADDEEGEEGDEVDEGGDEGDEENRAAGAAGRRRRPKRVATDLVVRKMVEDGNSLRAVAIVLKRNQKMEAEIRKMKDIVAERDATIQGLREQLEGLQGQLTERNAENVTLNRRLAENVSQNEGAIGQLQSRLDEANAERERCQGELRRVQGELDERTRERDDCRDANAALEQRVTAATAATETQLQEFNRQRSEWDTERQGFGTEREEAVAEARRLITDVKDAEIRRLTEERTRILAERDATIAEQGKRITELENRNQNLSSENSIQRDQIEQLRRDLNACSEARDRALEDVRALREGTLNSLGERNAELSRELSQATGAHLAARDTIGELTRIAEETRQKHNRDISELTLQKADADARVVKQDEQIKELQGLRDKNGAEILELKENVSAKERTILENTSKIRELEGDVQGLTGEIKAAAKEHKKRVQELENARDEAVAENEKLKGENVALSEKLADEKEKTEKLIQDVSDVKAELADAKNIIGELRAENERHVATIRTQGDQIVSLVRERDEERAAKEKAKSDLAAEIDNLSAAEKKHEQELKEKETLREDAVRRADLADEKAIGLEQELIEVKKARGEAQSKLGAHEAAHAIAKKEYQKTLGEKQGARSAAYGRALTAEGMCRTKEAENAKLLEQIEAKKTENAELREQIKAKETENAELREQIEQAEQKHATAIENLEKEVGGYKTKISELNRQLADAKRDNDAHVSKIADRDRTIEGLETDVASAKSNETSAKENLKQEKGKTLKLTEELDEAKENLEDKQREIVRLTTENGRIQERLVAANEEIGKLESREAEKDGLSDKVGRLGSTVKANGIRIKALEEANEELQTEVSNLRSTDAERNSELIKLKSALESQQFLNKTLEDQNRKTIESHNANFSRLKQQVEKALSSPAKGAQNGQLNAMLNELDKRAIMQPFEQQLEEFKRQIATYEKLHESWHTSLYAIHVSMREFIGVSPEQKMSNIGAEIDRLPPTIKAAIDHAREQVTAQYASATNISDVMRSQFDENARKTREAEEKLSSYDAATASIFGILNPKMTKSDAGQMTLEHVKTKLEAIRIQINNLVQDQTSPKIGLVEACEKLYTNVTPILQSLGTIWGKLTPKTASGKQGQELATEIAGEIDRINRELFQKLPNRLSDKMGSLGDTWTWLSKAIDAIAEENRESERVGQFAATHADTSSDDETRNQLEQVYTKLFVDSGMTNKTEDMVLMAGQLINIFGTALLPLFYNTTAKDRSVGRATNKVTDLNIGNLRGWVNAFKGEKESFRRVDHYSQSGIEWGNALGTLLDNLFAGASAMASTVDNSWGIVAGVAGIFDNKVDNLHARIIMYCDFMNGLLATGQRVNESSNQFIAVPRKWIVVAKTHQSISPHFSKSTPDSSKPLGEKLGEWLNHITDNTTSSGTLSPVAVPTPIPATSHHYTDADMIALKNYYGGDKSDDVIMELCVHRMAVFKRLIDKHWEQLPAIFKRGPQATTPPRIDKGIQTYIGIVESIFRNDQQWITRLNCVIPTLSLSLKHPSQKNTAGPIDTIGTEWGNAIGACLDREFLARADTSRRLAALNERFMSIWQKYAGPSEHTVAHMALLCIEYYNEAAAAVAAVSTPAAAAGGGGDLPASAAHATFAADIRHTSTGNMGHDHPPGPAPGFDERYSHSQYDAPQK